MQPSGKSWMTFYEEIICTLAKLISCPTNGYHFILQQEFPDLKKRYWGRHFWAIGYGGWSTGNITDEMVQEYLKHHRKPSNKDNGKWFLNENRTFSPRATYALSVHSGWVSHPRRYNDFHEGLERSESPSRWFGWTKPLSRRKSKLPFTPHSLDSINKVTSHIYPTSMG